MLQHGSMLLRGTFHAKALEEAFLEGVALFAPCSSLIAILPLLSLLFALFPLPFAWKVPLSSSTFQAKALKEAFFEGVSLFAPCSSLFAILPLLSLLFPLRPLPFA